MGRQDIRTLQDRSLDAALRKTAFALGMGEHRCVDALIDRAYERNEMLEGPDDATGCLPAVIVRPGPQGDRATGDTVGACVGARPRIVIEPGLARAYPDALLVRWPGGNVDDDAGLER